MSINAIEMQIANRYVGMVNNVSALIATLQSTRWPYRKKDFQIRAWGQLARTKAAERAIAYHIHNYLKIDDWKPISWRCEMEGETTDHIQTSGTFAPDFDVRAYMIKETEHCKR